VAKSCFLCDKKLGWDTFGKYALSQEECVIPKGFGDEDEICLDCLESQPKIQEKKVIQREEPKKPNPTRQPRELLPSNPSQMIWLLPIFLGLIGGLFMYILLQNEDKDRAKTGLSVGIVSSVGSGILLLVIWDLML